MSVSVVVPWRPGCPHREAAWAWVRDRYSAAHPDWQLIVGQCLEGPFSRSKGIITAAERADADILVVADADVWCDGIGQAVAHAADACWAVPHRLVHRLSPESTELVLAGADWQGLPLSSDNRQDARPYVGHETGTLVVVLRDVLLAVPPDPRFVGWGQEDAAWALALHTLVGRPRRGTADLVHLWHPPPQRQSRTVGSRENLALYRRYLRAGKRPDAIRSLLAETQEVRHGQVR